MKHRKWAVVGVAVAIGLVISVTIQGLYGILLAVGVGWALDWVASRLGLLEEDEDSAAE